MSEIVEQECGQSCVAGEYEDKSAEDDTQWCAS